MASDVSHFCDAAQFMLEMEDGTGVMGDVSYSLPSPSGYGLPQYWRTTVFSTEGVLETAAGGDGLFLARSGQSEPERLPPDPGNPGGVFRSFLREVAGEKEDLCPSTAQVIKSSRVTLRVQRAADQGDRDADL